MSPSPTPGKTDLLARFQHANPNHHLWNNNGTWWLHCTVHRPDYTKERLRESLETGDLAEARRRRDARLLELAARADLRLSIRPARHAHTASTMSLQTAA
jgi:hypothetical protein